MRPEAPGRVLLLRGRGLRGRDRDGAAALGLAGVLPGAAVVAGLAATEALARVLTAAGVPGFLEAQPPLPLQEFFPAQPLSPVLQPPLPLHELWLLQMFCSGFSAGLSLSLALSFSSALRAEPAARPAATAPNTFVNSRRFMRDSSLDASRVPSPRRPNQNSCRRHLEIAIHYRLLSTGAPACGKRGSGPRKLDREARHCCPYVTRTPGGWFYSDSAFTSRYRNSWPS